MRQLFLERIASVFVLVNRFSYKYSVAFKCGIMIRHSMGNMMSRVTLVSILSEAQHLFDAVGTATAEDGSWLMLGIATSKDRDLDEFIRREDGSINFTAGFEKHIKPRLEQLVEYIQQLGIGAKVFGNCGYPRGHELNIKQCSLAAGLGSWGRNSLLLHPEFGLDLRFAVIKLPNTELPSTGPDEVTYELSPLCASCHACEQACPINILRDGQVTDVKACLAAMENMTGGKTLSWCRNCIDVCPAGKEIQ
jgi:ferredoxin